MKNIGKGVKDNGKTCVNCGCKIGFVSGEHLDGLLCDNCYNKFGGILLLNLVTENNPKVFLECYDRIACEIDVQAEPSVDKEKIKRAFYKQMNCQYKRTTGLALDIQECIRQEETAKEKAKQKELERINYAK